MLANENDRYWDIAEKEKNTIILLGINIIFND